MILSCPTCSTRFLVADAAFGHRPRRVRCGQCRHEWRAEPPETPNTIDIIDTEVPSTDGIASDAANNVAAAEYESVAPQPVPEGSNLPAPIATPRPLLRRALVAVFFMLVVGLLATSSLYRDRFIEITENLWASNPLEALVIEDVKTRYVDEAGSWALVIEGNVRNQGERSYKIPAITLATKSRDGAQINHYTPELQSNEVAAHGTTSFSYTLREIGDNLAEVTVQFATP